MQTFTEEPAYQAHLRRVAKAARRSFEAQLPALAQQFAASAAQADKAAADLARIARIVASSKRTRQFERDMTKIQRIVAE